MSSDPDVRDGPETVCQREQTHAERVTPLLILTGPIGAGKTSVADEIARLLAVRGIAHAVVDMDALTNSFPRPADDPFNVRLGMRNLAALWANFAAAGAQRLVVADVLESRAESARYAAALPMAALTIVRLTASPQTLRRRIEQRETGASREWHLRRSVELTALMERASVGDLLVDTDGRSLADVAGEVLTRANWLAGTREERH